MSSCNKSELWTMNGDQVETCTPLSDSSSLLSWSLLGTHLHYNSSSLNLNMSWWTKGWGHPLARLMFMSIVFCVAATSILIQCSSQGYTHRMAQPELARPSPSTIHTMVWWLIFGIKAQHLILSTLLYNKGSTSELEIIAVFNRLYSSRPTDGL